MTIKVLATKGGDGLDIWTIYESPSDYPNQYVLRRCTVLPGETVHDIVPTKVGTLAECRAALPWGVTCLGRKDADEPQILESWV